MKMNADEQLVSGRYLLLDDFRGLMLDEVVDVQTQSDNWVEVRLDRTGEIRHIDTASFLALAESVKSVSKARREYSAELLQRGYPALAKVVCEPR